jgi:ABC-type glycerol-3-phosphate transport system substrate-binding protein
MLDARGRETPAVGEGAGVRRPSAPATRRRVLTSTALGAGAALAGGALLASCAGQGGQTAAGSAQPATVTYLHFDTGQQVWQDSWKQIFDGFAAKYPGSKVQADLVTQALTNISQKGIATYAAGGTYDLFYGHFTILSEFLSADIIEPLDAHLSKDRDVKVDDYYPAATERMKSKLYGIAWFTQGKELFYNANLLQESGAPLPRQLEQDGKWTWDALLDVAKKVTRTDGTTNSVYGFNAGYSDPGTYVNSLYAWGADFFDKGYTRPTIDAPQFLTATQFAVDLVAKHKVSGGGSFPQRQLGILLGSGASTRGWDDQIMKPNLFKIEHTMLPKGPAGRACAMANNCMYLGKGSKVPDAAWAFYKYLISSDVQPQIAQLGGGRYTANKKLKPTTLFAFEDAAVYQASAAVSRPTPLIVRQADFQKDWADAWKAMTEGTSGVNDSLKQLQDKTALYLKEGCIC